MFKFAAKAGVKFFLNVLYSTQIENRQCPLTIFHLIQRILDEVFVISAKIQKRVHFEIIGE